MSFAPSKNRRTAQQDRGKKGTGSGLRGDRSEEIKDNPTPQSNRADDEAKMSRSQRSDADSSLAGRVSMLESEISSLLLRQDTYRDLLSLRDEFQTMQKDQKMLASLVKRTTKIEEKLEDFEKRFDEYQAKTEKWLFVMDQNINEESKLRESENKKIKKVCTELEKRQNDMDYNVKLDIQKSEINVNEEVVKVASNLDKKVEAHKEFLENHIKAVHKATKSALADDEDRIERLEAGLQEANSKFDSKVSKLENIVMPTIDTQNKRRKIDYSDLKAWLLESIDNRLKGHEKKLEKTVKKNYKAVAVTQKYATSSQRGRSSFEVPQEAEAAPASQDQHSERISEGGAYGAAASEAEGFEEVETKFDKESDEHNFIKSVIASKSAIKRLENDFDNTSKETEHEIDKQKIELYSFTSKHNAASEKIAALKKSKKTKSSKEIKGN